MRKSTKVSRGSVSCAIWIISHSVASCELAASTWKAFSHCSEIRLHPNGKWLYVGNRGHDSIAVYGVDPRTGHLSLVRIEPSGGACPRERRN